MSSNFCSLLGCVIRVCTVGANGRTCFFGGGREKLDVWNFLSFSINVDAVRVYVAGTDGLVSSFINGFFEKIKNIL
jgi:hypothetical protein